MVLNAGDGGEEAQQPEQAAAAWQTLVRSPAVARNYFLLTGLCWYLMLRVIRYQEEFPEVLLTDEVDSNMRTIKASVQFLLVLCAAASRLRVYATRIGEQERGAGPVQALPAAQSDRTARQTQVRAPFACVCCCYLLVSMLLCRCAVVRGSLKPRYKYKEFERYKD